MALAAGGASLAPGQEKPTVQKASFVRPMGKEFIPECEIAITRDAASWSIESVTTRGETRMTVRASYGNGNILREASAELRQGDTLSAARATVADKLVRVRRHDGTEQELPHAAGIIVTSAPDWCDIFMLCRNYDRKAGGRQKFPALWLHPTQPAQVAVFAIERQGTQAILRDGKPMQLERFRVEIRGGSAYVAWANTQGELIKLAPLPFKAGSGIVRSGWADVYHMLAPPLEPK